MTTISKAELLQLIDERLPEDARIALFGTMAYEVYDIEENINELIVPVGDILDENELPEDIGDATYLLTSA